MNVGDSIVTPSKPFWKSTTLWVQALSILILIVGLVIEAKDVYDLDSRWLATLGIVTAVLTSIIRVVKTVQPLDGSNELTTRALTVTNTDGTASA